MSMESHGDLGSVEVHYRGISIEVYEDSLPSRGVRVSGNPDTTGRLVWECSALFLKWLSSDDNIALLCSPQYDKVPQKITLENVGTILDVSSGAGLVPLALSKAGAKCVLSWETALQLPHLVSNTVGTRVIPQEYYWGTDPTSLLSQYRPISFSLCSDVLYIALRDGLARHLSLTLRSLTKHVEGAVLFGFEERLLREEQEFMDSLRLPLEMICGGEGEETSSTFFSSPAPPIVVVELPVKETRLMQDEALLRKPRVLPVTEDDGSTGASMADLFWEPPPIRLFLLYSQKEMAP